MMKPVDYITRLRIDLEPDGRLEDVVVTRPSGSRELDGQEADGRVHIDFLLIAPVSGSPSVELLEAELVQPRFSTAC
jgi:hypothetical protein